MPKLSERQCLWLTIGTSVVLAGAVTALIFADRQAIHETQREIVGWDDEDGLHHDGYEDRIRMADVEIAKTKERESAVVVFREVSPRELEILPQRQQIADFHQNLTTFLTQAGGSFTKLPESAPKESELAKGIYVTPNTVEFEADAGSLLRFVNMLENDPRLVAVKGLRCKGGARQNPNSDRTPMHKVEVSLETYYYNPATAARAPVPIPNYASRLDDADVRAAIASFTPETRDSYQLRPASHRRDPFVDVRKEVVIEDPEVVRKRFEEEEKVVLDLEQRYDRVREKVEAERVLAEMDDLFKQDRVAQEVDALVNDLRVLLANAASVKSVTFPELETRVDKVKGGVEAVAAGRRDQPRLLTITPEVARKTREVVAEAFGKGDFAEVNSLCMAWEQFLRGKTIKAEAQTVLSEVKALRQRAKVLSEFQSLSIHVTGVMVHALEPARSVALVNGNVVRTGDPLPERRDVKVEGVDRGGVEFSYQGERIHRPVESAMSAGRASASGVPLQVGAGAPR